MAATIPCPDCLGSAVLHGLPCERCGGDGEVVLHIDDLMDVECDDDGCFTCPWCAGTGIRDGEDCDTCHGERRISLDDWELAVGANWWDIDFEPVEVRR